jgi:hypothetical protein
MVLTTSSLTGTQFRHLAEISWALSSNDIYASFDPDHFRRLKVFAELSRPARAGSAIDEMLQQEPHPRGSFGTMRGKIARLEVPACHITFLKNAHRKCHIVRLAIIVSPKAID